MKRLITINGEEMTVMTKTLSIAGLTSNDKIIMFI